MILNRSVSLCVALSWVLLAACGSTGTNTPSGGTPDGGTSGPCAFTIKADINAPATWIHGTTACDYLVDGQISVAAALIVQPSVVVRFTAHSWLDVKPTGSLHAAGGSSTPIIFTSTASKGYWGSLIFESNDPANELTYAQVSYGGDTTLGMIGEVSVVTGGKLKLTHSSIGQSGSFGLYAMDGTHLDGFSTNVFSANTKAPVTVPIAGPGQLDTASDYSGGSAPNGEAWVAVTATATFTTTIDNQTWRALNVPYLLSAGVSGSQMQYGGALTISPGATLEFEADSGLLIMETGSLSAVGTALAPIVFTGRIQSAGYWKGLGFRSNAGNTLDHTVVSYGGSSTFCCGYGGGGLSGHGANLVVGDTGGLNSAFTLTNSTVLHAGPTGYGYYVFPGASITQSGNAFTDNGLNNFP